jgi:hypothetical protein
LSDVRDELFGHAIGRFWQQLQAAGIEDKPDFSMKKRTKQRNKLSQSTRIIGTDIIGLYEYSAELNDHFPKDVISGSCMDRYIKLNKNVRNNERDAGAPPECNGASHLVLIAQVQEMKAQLAEERKCTKQLTDRLEVVEKTLNAVQLQFTLFQYTHEATTTTAAMGNKDNTTAVEDNNEDATAAEGPDHEGDAHERGNETGDNVHNNDTQVITVNDANSDEEDANDWEDTNTDPQSEVGGHDEGNVEDNTEFVNDDVLVVPANTPEALDDAAGNKTMYSVAASKPGPWMKKQGRDRKRPSQVAPRFASKAALYSQTKVTVTDKVRVVSHKNEPHTTYIFGVQRGGSTMLYLRNIYCGTMGDEELASAVKKQGSSMGMQILHAEVVHNNWCSDIVGCKIRVPVAQVDHALDPFTWPDNIKCKHWEDRRPRNK